MCKYCDCKVSGISEFDYSNGIESVNSNSVFAHVCKNPKNNKFYFEINESLIGLFEIKFCPICGRELT